MEDMESVRERTLIERVRGGDPDAFADLVRPWRLTQAFLRQRRR
jgi:hypothetical protein